MDVSPSPTSPARPSLTTALNHSAGPPLTSEVTKSGRNRGKAPEAFPITPARLIFPCTASGFPPGSYRFGPGAFFAIEIPCINLRTKSNDNERLPSNYDRLRRRETIMHEKPHLSIYPSFPPEEEESSPDPGPHPLPCPDFPPPLPQPLNEDAKPCSTPFHQLLADLSCLSCASKRVKPFACESRVRPSELPFTIEKAGHTHASVRLTIADFATLLALAGITPTGLSEAPPANRPSSNSPS